MGRGIITAVLAGGKPRHGLRRRRSARHAGRVSTSVGATEPPVLRRPWGAVPTAIRHPLRFGGTVLGRVADDGILTLAAAMAYYFFFSLFPLVLFVVALVSVLPLSGLESWLLSQAAQFLPGEAYGLIEGTIHDLVVRPQHGLLSIGVLLTLWTASSAFVAVNAGLGRAYRAYEWRPWWRVRLQAMGLTIALSLFMMLTFVLTIFGGQLAAFIGRVGGPALEVAALVIRWTIVVFAVSVVVAAVDQFGPAVPARWRWVTPGSLVFMSGFAAASAAFSYYVGHFATYNATYGSLGAVIILLFWMYMLAFFLLLGGEVNAVLEHLTAATELTRAPEGAALTAGGRSP